MKLYLWQILCAVACLALLKFRPWPGLPIVIIGFGIIIASCVLTYIGDKKADQDMWWRIACAVVSVLVIGLAQ